jgi:hypothetical protein
MVFLKKDESKRSFWLRGLSQLRLQYTDGDAVLRKDMENVTGFNGIATVLGFWKG